jgi:hypothetical protein
MTNGSQDNPAESATAGGNAYANLAAADAWFAARGKTGWQLHDTAARHAALIAAADWLDGVFRFAGSPLLPTQVRAWPRRGIGAVQAGGMSVLPLPVQQAYFELAQALLEGEGAAERLCGFSGAVRREKIGGLAIDYAVAARGGGRLTALLAPYLAIGTATRVVRT